MYRRFKDASETDLNSNMSDMMEAVLCGEDEIQNGEMKEFEVDGAKVLLVRDHDNYYAIGGKCSHYGAPLSKGAYSRGQVRCPWHGACFNIKTGDIEDFPGLDGVPKFDVSCSGGKIKVRCSKEQLAKPRMTKKMCSRSKNYKKTVLIIGGGPASVVCAETLRQERFDGRIIIATTEKYLPYDRIKLSKALTVDPESIALRKEEFYSKYDIEVQLEKEAVSVDTEKSNVSFKGGESIAYDYLLVATGGKPRVLPTPGVGLSNIFSLRTPSDAKQIAAQASNKDVVIIGSSFIGMEVAAFLSDKAASVTVADMIQVPFQLTLGEKIGTVLQRLHEDKGVKFHLNSGIKEFHGTAGEVTQALLNDGTVLTADVVVLGVGVVPATDFLKDSGIIMTQRGFVTVDKRMKTNIANVFAAGDITEFPLVTHSDDIVNIQHFQMAHQQGKIAAHNILRQNREIKSVPYFWTVQYGKSIRYTGYGVGYDDVVVHGDLEEYKFIAYYTKGDDVVACASLASDPIVSQVAEMMSNGRVIKKNEIMSNPTAWLARL